MNLTRNHILAISKDIFRKKGYNGAGIKEILQESGIPRGSLYYHFPMGKEELALEVLKTYEQERSEDFKRAVYKENIDQALCNIVQLFIDDLILTEYQCGCPVMNMALAGGQGKSRIQMVAADALQYWENQLVKFYNKRKVENAVEKAPLFLSALDGAFATSKIYKNIDRLNQLKKNIYLFT